LISEGDKMKRAFIAGFVTASILLSAGCVVNYPPPSISEIGTAKHYVNSGMMLLEKGKIPDAMWQFDRAIELDSSSAMAYVGRAMAHLLKNDLKRCEANLEFAQSVAQGDEDWINVDIGYMRFFTAQKKQGWLEAVQRQFKSALDIDPRYKATYFYMGMAYKEAFDFKSAEKMFERVLEINDPFLIRADHQWKLVRKILTAQPTSYLGKVIALQPQLSRAQLAGRLIKELDLERLLQDNIIRQQGSQESLQEKVPDIQTDVLKADIEAVLRLQVEGLSLMPDNLFHPAEIVTRGDLAAVIEGLMKKTGDNISPWQPKMTTSPFRDMDVGHPLFRAALYCVTLGFMNVNDISTEEFAPDLPASGSDAILAIRKIRDQIRYR
jgi:Tfp pilus assembly protein PilF